MGVFRDLLYAAIYREKGYSNKQGEFMGPDPLKLNLSTEAVKIVHIFDFPHGKSRPFNTT